MILSIDESEGAYLMRDAAPNQAGFMAARADGQRCCPRCVESTQYQFFVHGPMDYQQSHDHPPWTLNLSTGLALMHRFYSGPGNKSPIAVIDRSVSPVGMYNESAVDGQPAFGAPVYYVAYALGGPGSVFVVWGYAMFNQGKLGDRFYVEPTWFIQFDPTRTAASGSGCGSAHCALRMRNTARNPYYLNNPEPPPEEPPWMCSQPTSVSIVEHDI